MNIDINDIDFDALRRDLINYFGTATPMFPMAYVDVINVDSASDIELLNIINQTSLNILDYVKNDKTI